MAQKINLKIISKKELENTILNKIDFQKKHKDTFSVQLEINRISNYLKKIGYFTNTIDSIKKSSKEHFVYFSLNDRINKAIIKVGLDATFILTNFKPQNGFVKISIKKLQKFLQEVSMFYESQGKSFSKVQLKNIRIKNMTLFADLEIHPSKKRTINKVIVKGYEKFPNSFLKNYFFIKSNSVFNQKKINKISNASKSLEFITEIKPPEVLFTKDSTFIYLYFKKRKNNSFDGLVNFASKENGNLLLNGTIDLKLNNVLDSGEKFELFWNSIGYERQEFKVLTEIPYIFNSAITPKISFTIYKQDSIFLNTKFDAKIKYSITNKLKFGLSYTYENSQNLQQSDYSNNVNTFTSNFMGFHLTYFKPKNDLFFNNTFFLEVNPSLGNRKMTTNSSNQFKIRTIASYIWNINDRNSIYIKNETGFLNSGNYLNNELFRIGGANSIRGFNEQSIFTSNYSYFNIEYRFLTSKKSYLYSITDFGKIKEVSTHLFSFGIGYLFKFKSSLINITYVTSKKNNTDLINNNSKLRISLKSFF